MYYYQQFSNLFHNYSYKLELFILPIASTIVDFVRIWRIFTNLTKFWLFCYFLIASPILNNIINIVSY